MRYCVVYADGRVAGYKDTEAEARRYARAIGGRYYRV